ncbi:MAG: outer-membrane lipoprotein carrier protein LolA [Elusimicrobiota bacterium]|nr:MAG: outer-membrane lipoprotein carrier protein LolA [Elusimicrobiota bacterium]
MRIHLGIGLLLLTTPCFSKPGKAPKNAASTVAASTAAAGTELSALAPSTAPLTLEYISQRFAETDGKINTIKTSFRQFVRLDGSDTVQTVEGDVLFKKPDLIRLTHKIPEPQTVVSDGTYLWVHRNSTNQVIQTKLEAWRKSEPLAQGVLDFGASADLLQRYNTVISTVSAPGPDGHRTFELKLTPKAKTADEFVLTLKSDTKTFFPREAALRVGRASIRSLFENVRLNPELPPETFKFTPPSDADLFKSPEPK